MEGISTILVALDFSPYAQEVLGFATKLAKGSDAKLLLVHVINQGTLDAVKFTENSTGMMNENEYIAKQTEERTAKIQKIADGNECAGVATSIKISAGVPWEQILKVADESSADLLICGTKGQGDSPHLLFGSNADKLHKKSTISLLTVRGQKHADLLCKLED